MSETSLNVPFRISPTPTLRNGGRKIMWTVTLTLVVFVTVDFLIPSSVGFIDAFVVPSPSSPVVRSVSFTGRKSLSSSSSSSSSSLHPPVVDSILFRKSTASTQLSVSKLPERVEERSTTTSTTTTPGPSRPRRSGGGNGGGETTLDPSSYEATLIRSWDTDPSLQTGFDWEIEKLRRYAAGLRRTDDGTWIRQPSFFEFLVNGVTRNKPKMMIEPPKPTGFVDAMAVMTVNILTSLGFGSMLGMASVPNAIIQKYEGSFFKFIRGVLGGDLQTLAGGPLFLLLAKYYKDYGPIFNLSFGPKSFLVVSDPVMARHILREARTDQYCKGMLAEILEPIMGKGLIPADPETWKVRRRAVVPGFHKKWLNRMVELFSECADNLVTTIDDKCRESPLDAVVLDMEERFCSVTLDIIGQAVFNYDFGSVTKESPIVKAVYRTLREAEHRSSSFIPYWNLPYASQWMGGQVEFRRDMGMLDDILTDLINRAVVTRREATVEELEARDYATEHGSSKDGNDGNDAISDPSLLRFLVDMRGEDLSSVKLRDDLMTMLIAGHETTAAMLTWTMYELAAGPPAMLKCLQREVREVLGPPVAGRKNVVSYDQILAMPRLRLALIEALRLYPEPPVLIRRARTEDTLPAGGSGISTGVKILRGTDLFVSTWNLHRSPELWEDPETYDPTRWERPFRNEGVVGWEGYDPDRYLNGNSLYPNEIAADFAFLPFGGGQRKCVGDQFAMLEATTTMAIVLNNIEFSFATSAEDVGMQTGATIHTMNGLNMIVRKRSPDEPLPEDDGWWERQHLKRGLDRTGKPYPMVRENDNENDNVNDNDRTGGPPHTADHGHNNVNVNVNVNVNTNVNVNGNVNLNGVHSASSPTHGGGNVGGGGCPVAH